MSAPSPYQNQPHQPHQPQYGQQPQYVQPQPPQGPRPGGMLRMVKSAVIVIAIFGGLAYYVYDYNTDPNGGKAKAEASASAQASEDATHTPSIGDCVKVKDPKGEPVPTIVDCGSSEAEYKTEDVLMGEGEECGSEYDYGILVSNSRSMDYTYCFTKV
ncbi:LppU/SCO3897 family protein [Streptomyces sp. T028]|uniref:LppU/SCO3897 family protein n=1 Tax=Streptomyces sp. T028 TaxID=3394379 RepID=UPI003A867CD1